jgi:hypothetical protein
VVEDLTWKNLWLFSPLRNSINYYEILDHSSPISRSPQLWRIFAQYSQLHILPIWYFKIRFENCPRPSKRDFITWLLPMRLHKDNFSCLVLTKKIDSMDIHSAVWIIKIINILLNTDIRLVCTIIDFLYPICVVWLKISPKVENSLIWQVCHDFFIYLLWFI